MQLTDQTVHYPAGIAENIPVKIRNFFIPVDFVVLDMEVDTKMPLILGRPFLSTANAHIDVGAGEIQLNINGQKEKFAFKPKVEQCSLVKEAHRKKKPEKEAKKPSLPNQSNAKRRIQRKKFLESQKTKVETPPTHKKVWRKKVSSPQTPSGDDNQTKGMESPPPDSKPEPSP